MEGEGEVGGEEGRRSGWALRVRIHRSAGEGELVGVSPVWGTLDLAIFLWPHLCSAF